MNREGVDRPAQIAIPPGFEESVLRAGETFGKFSASFFTPPAPIPGHDQGMICCTIQRVREGTRGLRYLLKRESDGTTLLVASRRKGNSYEIYADPQRPSTSVVGVLISSFSGTKYVTYKPGTQPGEGVGSPVEGSVKMDENVMSRGAEGPELCMIEWETSLMSLAPQRKMTVTCPLGGSHSLAPGSPPRQAPQSPSEARSPGHSQANPLLQSPPPPQPPLTQSNATNASKPFMVLKNREPVWCSKTRAYCLDFGNRVTETSTKNFQLEKENKEVIVTCGRTGKDTFICDFASPITPIVAFSVAISSFDFKLCYAI